jgi:S1-C subfamily serine protease
LALAAAIGLLTAEGALAADPPEAAAAPKPPASEAAPTPKPTTAADFMAVPPGAQVRPFGFTRVFAKLPSGKAWSHPHGGIFCAPQGSQSWNGGEHPQNPTPYVETLREEMHNAGFKVDGDPDNIFEPTASTADIQLGAIITDMDIDYCEPMIGYGNTEIHGGATMSVQWEVYSTIQKSIIAKIETSGEASFKSNTAGGVDALVRAAFRENVQRLIAADAFRQAMIGAPTAPGDILKPASLTTIDLAGALAARARPVSDAVGSVVLIFAGDTQGSGFLASSDGYVITDRHVIGEAKYVKVRWPDGVEGLGEVVRSDKTRDVALIKTDPRGRQPLRIRKEPLQPGDTVFAIGSPLGQKFEGTVTRGVVSAYRTFSGLNFIQSDVAVNPGSSGGPLLDDKGEVVATTESGYRVAGAPTDINLFIPLGDALDFLGAQPK